MRPRPTRLLLALTIVVAGMAGASETASAVDDAPPPSSTESAAEGEGYGGSSDWLLVEVSDGRVHLRGGGFQADSDVEVEIGSRFSTVSADELGNVDVWLEIASGELIVARGVAADGSSRVVVPSVGLEGATSSLQTVLAVLVGAIGAWLLLRDSQRIRVLPLRRQGY